MVRKKYFILKSFLDFKCYANRPLGYKTVPRMNYGVSMDESRTITESDVQRLISGNHKHTLKSKNLITI